MKIIKIGELSEELYSVVGGKARGLDFMKKKGYTVADGFVVTDIDTLGDSERAAIKNAYLELGAKKVSVRSSATNEDGGYYSSAGQYETCLNVTESELDSAIDKCIASLSGERARVYSDKMTGESAAKMNLVIEEMIDAKAAGVMFTRDPSSSACVLIDSVDGLGENLVSGSSSAYSYSIPRAAFSYSQDGNLTEATLLKIYTEGKEIAELFGTDSDLEWATDSEDNLFWLQLRPITATSEDADPEEFDTKNPIDNHLLTTRNIGEMMPGAVTPLSISTSVLAIDYGMREMLSRTGAIKNVHALPDFAAAFAIRNHLFIDMTVLHSMSNRVMMSSPEAMNLSIMGEYDGPSPKPEGKKAFGLIRFINALKFAKYLFSSKKARKKAIKLNERLHFENNGSIDGIYAEICEKLPEMNKVLCHHYVCSSFSGAMNSALFMTLAKDFSEKSEYQAFVATILSDIDGIESADILASLTAIAEAIKEECENARSLSEKELLEFVKDEKNAKTNALYTEFLKKHGHRSIKEAEMRSKAWKNDELSLIKNIRTVLMSNPKPEEEKKPFCAKELFRDFSFMKRGSLGWIANNARKAVRDRESSKSNIIKVIDKFKDRYALLAKKLTEAGLLSDEDSIYFLTHEEIGKLIAGDTRLKRSALARRLIFADAEELSFEDAVIGKPVPISADSAASEGAMHGIPVCKGRVYGKARIVKSPEDAEKIEKGEIMVAAFTDIGWSPYYSLVSALITEVGSALSHGAVVAREYCLPTVVNVKGATKLIKDGDYLFVDANHGSVTVITEEEYLKRKEAQEQ